MPRDPQGAGTRTETKVEWRNVYASRHARLGGRVRVREHADAEAVRFTQHGITRIAIERIETTTTITREPITDTEAGR